MQSLALKDDWILPMITWNTGLGEDFKHEARHTFAVAVRRPPLNASMGDSLPHKNGGESQGFAVNAENKDREEG